MKKIIIITRPENNSEYESFKSTHILEVCTDYLKKTEKQVEIIVFPRGTNEDTRIELDNSQPQIIKDIIENSEYIVLNHEHKPNVNLIVNCCNIDSQNVILYSSQTQHSFTITVENNNINIQDFTYNENADVSNLWDYLKEYTKSKSNKEIFLNYLYENLVQFNEGSSTLNVSSLKVEEINKIKNVYKTSKGSHFEKIIELRNYLLTFPDFVDNKR